MRTHLIAYDLGQITIVNANSKTTIKILSIHGKQVEIIVSFTLVCANHPD